MSAYLCEKRIILRDKHINLLLHRHQHLLSQLQNPTIEHWVNGIYCIIRHATEL